MLAACGAPVGKGDWNASGIGHDDTVARPAGAKERMAAGGGSVHVNIPSGKTFSSREQEVNTRDIVGSAHGVGAAGLTHCGRERLASMTAELAHQFGASIRGGVAL